MDLKKLRELELIVFDLDFQAVDASRVDPPRPVTATKMRKLVETAWKESLANDRSQNFKAQVLDGRLEFESQELYEQFIGERSQNVVENAAAELIEGGNAVRVVHAIVAHLCDILRVSNIRWSPKISPSLHAVVRSLFARHLSVLHWELACLNRRFQLPVKMSKLRDVCLNYFANSNSRNAKNKMRFVIEQIMDLPSRMVERRRKKDAKVSSLPTLYYELDGRRSKLHDESGHALLLNASYIDDLLKLVDPGTGMPLDLSVEQICKRWNRRFRQQGRRGKIDKSKETAATVVTRVLSKIKVRLSKKSPTALRGSGPVFDDLIENGLAETADTQRKLRFKLLGVSSHPVRGTHVPRIATQEK